MSATLLLIKEGLDRFSPQEKRLADYILEQPELVQRLGITELASACGISAATVTRFCKSLRFKGFPDFKMRLIGELSRPSEAATYQDIVAGRPLKEIARAIEANHLSSITDTTRLLDPEALERAVAALGSARRIDLYGMGTSSIVAQDLYQKLIRIGKSCTAFADSHMQITSASTLNTGDVALAISYSGETPETIAALRCAKDAGALTLSLTRYGTSPLPDLADIPLFTSSLEEGVRRGAMASRIAQLHVIDILFAGMLSEGFDEYVPMLEQSYHNVRQYLNPPGGAKS
ncbi:MULTISPECIES: MurR/RpiR family transcriptional regulator [Saccharibacillus]|uniref:MurR/RpiR family transcriptional regulator n=1 Tax=Saccharibacillus brassicae TaxID=2583377 RepID=A0A4Y6URV2_SACBS|nr:MULTISPECIES: MurR/RpiR family transcriptional regulator [Saccharibacillus]MWJ31361.1 SIS domain-containing protein [Saccharibacillus sp. WB 17]QDH20383.1 MurR/RpiR family transcriptional regulator [Saccharibacillus brassicae]